MRIPESVRKCVVFLGIQKVDDNSEASEVVFCGTGFLVSLPTPIFKKEFIYIVTAKHVAVMLERKEAFYMSVNPKSGTDRGVRVATIRVKWHYDESAFPGDVALIALGHNLTNFDITTVPTESFVKTADIQSMGIGPGDEVFITGLFSIHPGKSKNMPIVRFGNIAMIPDERIHTAHFGDMDAYLIEARSIGGLSGSPVFVLKQETVGTKMYLLGLIHGHWEMSEEAEQLGIMEGINVGISIVVPAQKILDILENKILLKEREGIVRDFNSRPKTPPEGT